MCSAVLCSDEICFVTLIPLTSVLLLSDLRAAGIWEIALVYE